MPRGKNMAKKWGQGPFSNNFFCRDVIQFFFTGTKTKTDPNYRDENHI